MKEVSRGDGGGKFSSKLGVHKPRVEESEVKQVNFSVFFSGSDLVTNTQTLAVFPDQRGFP